MIPLTWFPSWRDSFGMIPTITLWRDLFVVVGFVFVDEMMIVDHRLTTFRCRSRSTFSGKHRNTFHRFPTLLLFASERFLAVAAASIFPSRVWLNFIFRFFLRFGVIVVIDVVVATTSSLHHERRVQFWSKKRVQIGLNFSSDWSETKMDFDMTLFTLFKNNY